MKTLIAILSCESYRINGNNQAMHDTWLPYVANEASVDYKIFMGQGSKCDKEDEVFLNVPDGYQYVTYKARAMHKYAADHGYTHIFKCYPDTYVCLSRLMASGFQKYDYVGNFACRPVAGPYCTGGAGYWVSRKAYENLIDAHIPTEDVIIESSSRRPLRIGRSPRRLELPTTTRVVHNTLMWADDKWTGEILAKLPTLKSYHDLRYEENVLGAGPEEGNQTISIHLSRWRKEGQAAHYDKQWLYDKHEKWLHRSVKQAINKIAIITPTIPRRHELLAECKDSVLSQTWGGEVFHAVGIDTFHDGPSVVRNNIIRDLDPSFEWLAFVDDDDVVFPEHLAILIEASADADVIYSDCIEEGFIKTWKTRAFNYNEVKADNYIPVTVLMRRSLFEKVGGYKISPPGEDQELWLRCAEAGARFVYVPKVTWKYRQHPQLRGY